MRQYLKYVAPVLMLALVAGGLMALKDVSLLGMRPAQGSEPAARAVPPIDAAQPTAFETATFAFG